VECSEDVGQKVPLERKLHQAGQVDGLVESLGLQNRPGDLWLLQATQRNDRSSAYAGFFEGAEPQYQLATRRGVRDCGQEAGGWHDPDQAGMAQTGNSPGTDFGRQAHGSRYGGKVV